MKCPECEGTGIIGNHDCCTCEGKGFLPCTVCGEDKDELKQTFYGLECNECIAIHRELAKDTADDR